MAERQCNLHARLIFLFSCNTVHDGEIKKVFCLLFAVAKEKLLSILRVGERQDRETMKIRCATELFIKSFFQR
jgi:hypothetical protein